MKIYYNYLSDTDFLKELSKMPVKTYFVHITILSWDEQPITAIQGRVISANFNIDGQSSVRRTANLSIALDQSMTQIIDAENVLSINKKIMILNIIKNMIFYGFPQELILLYVVQLLNQIAAWLLHYNSRIRCAY